VSLNGYISVDSFSMICIYISSQSDLFSVFNLTEESVHQQLSWNENGEHKTLNLQRKAVNSISNKGPSLALSLLDFSNRPKDHRLSLIYQVLIFTLKRPTPQTPTRISGDSWRNARHDPVEVQHQELMSLKMCL